MLLSTLRRRPILLLLVGLACLHQLGAVAHAQTAATVVPATRVSSTCTPIAVQKGIPCPDFEEGNISRSSVWVTFQSENFAALDLMYQEWCTGKSIFTDGQWQLTELSQAYGAFGVVMPWERSLAEIRSWQTSNPESEAAQFTEAEYWWHYAWFARGQGYASTVTKEAWQLYGERLEKSKAILARLIASGSKCPVVYSAMIANLSVTGATEQTLRSVFSDAVRKFPGYHGLYFAMSQHYEPRWGGSLEQFEAFADEAARLSKDVEGMGMYARLYWIVDTEFGTPFVNKSSRYPQWAKLKQGFDDLMRRYPSSMHNIAQYAGVACRAGEAQLYRSLRATFSGFEEQATAASRGLLRFDACDRTNGWTAVGASDSAASASDAIAPTPTGRTSFPPPPSARLPGNCTSSDLSSKRLCLDSSIAVEELMYLQRGFMERNFEGLDLLFTQWCEDSSQQPSGLYRLPSYSSGLQSLLSAYGKWPEDLAAIRLWQRSRPDSVAARFVEAAYWYEYGWAARGPRYSTKVAKEEMAIFAERLTRAKSILEQIRRGNLDCPAPDALLLTVLSELRAPDAELRNLFLDATRKHPHYHDLYFAMAHHFEPKWGGSAAAFEAFASDAAEQTGAFEGMGLYSRIYEQVDFHGGIPFNEDSGAPPAWKKLKAGYEDLMRRYPSSMLIVAHYASVACRSSDGPLYRNLRAKFSGHEEEAHRLTDGTLDVDICDRKHGWGADGR